MKPRSLVISACIVLCAGLVLPADAQVSPASAAPIFVLARGGSAKVPLKEGFTVRRDVEEAQIRFFATDRSGKPIVGLRPEDIQVFDDRVRVPELKSFTMSQYRPLEIGVLVDLSESIGPQQQGEALMAADLLGEIFDSHRDEAFVVGFSNNVRLLQSQTKDVSLVRDALLHNPGHQGLTSLFDALVQTCRTEFRDSASEGRQRILLLFSDGDDTLSFHDLDDALQEALRSEVTIYAVTSSERGSDGFRILRQLTQQTGGKVYVIQKKQDMGTLKVALNDSVRGEYTVSFHPATEASGFHPVRIELRERPDAILRGGSGYYMASR
ncbi:MAG: VWA domain-containing protein [Terriglobia bacterium]|nr:VWA domain-containing protein [Terriglobia bacterium]